ncbi:MAG: hydrogenase maturation protease [Planctomycetaceae bacterium]
MRSIIRVVGVGSPHGDDQVGWRLAEGLADETGSGLEAVVIADPIDLLVHLDGCESLIVLDACRTGRPPGTVTCLTWPDGGLETTGGRSTHGYGVASALALAHALGRLPPSVILFAVEAGVCEPAAELSPEVRRSLPEVRRQLQALLRRR